MENFKTQLTFMFLVPGEDLKTLFRWSDFEV
jgi:hypothetical protein